VEFPASALKIHLPVNGSTTRGDFTRYRAGNPTHFNLLVAIGVFSTAPASAVAALLDSDITPSATL
jgi:hypothetical protein